MKIGLIAAALLLAATAVFHGVATSELKASAARAVEDEVSRAQRVFQHISRLSGIDFANVAAERARRPNVVAIFDRADVTARRQAAYEECEVMNAALAKESRRADLLAILDASGKVVARDLNPQAMYGEDLRVKHPAVDQALKGNAVKDIWTLGDRMTEVALAPIIKPDGTTVGAVLVGYVVSTKKAQMNRDVLGTDIAYFHNGKVQTSSFASAGAEKEDVNKTSILASFLFGPEKVAEQALTKGAPTDVRRIEIEGREYAIVAAPLPGNFADNASGVALLASISDATDRLRSVGMNVIALGLLAILVALAATILTAKRFMKPLDEIELGVAEIINGNIDYTFRPVGPDFEGLSNSLNVMLARLLGRDEPNEDAVEEEEGEGRRWKAEQMIMEEGDGAQGAGAGLAQESEASYYPRLYNEYVNALRSVGKPADGVSVQAFMAKLRLTEAGLRQKWSCRMVRFQLVTRGEDVVLRAVRID